MTQSFYTALQVLQKIFIIEYINQFFHTGRDNIILALSSST